MLSLLAVGIRNGKNLRYLVCVREQTECGHCLSLSAAYIYFHLCLYNVLCCSHVFNSVVSSLEVVGARASVVNEAVLVAAVHGRVEDLKRAILFTSCYIWDEIQLNIEMRR